MTETSGASVVVPAGALSTDTTIRIAMDSTGAPALPAGLNPVGNTYVVTPHGGDFAEPIEVRIPAPNVTLQPNQTLKLAKAQPNGEWEVLDNTTLAGGTLSAKVQNFSFFRSVVITYVLPIMQMAPMDATATLDCAEQSCDGALFTANATYTVVTNNGAFPENCADGSVRLIASEGYSQGYEGLLVARSGGVLRETATQASLRRTYFAVVKCGNWNHRLDGASKAIAWAWPANSRDVNIIRVPAQLDVVQGMTANLEVILSNSHANDAEANGTVVDWQRSDDGGTSWRNVARSYWREAAPVPVRADIFWAARYGFVGTATDQGALIRVHACNTRSTGVLPPCVFGTPTRLNVLQQSSAPVIVDALRSVLVRTGQTASLSATASGLPAPTLQWQTRPANSNAAWTDVTTGTGATTANYTTIATTLADNGTQYRLLATNAVGSTPSNAVSVSVSDVDVAPSIATQPSNLSVASGSDAVFAVDARGTEALSYQWRRNGVAIAGANSPVLRLSGVTILNSGSFSVTVSNSAGDADSNSATLNVFPGIPAAVAPTIVTQPASLTVNVGNTATFAVGVDGSGPFTFQWRRNGFNIPGASSAVLTLPSVVSDASGQYSVVVSNGVGPGVTSANASLSVSSIAGAEPPTIVTQPSTIVVARGGSAVLAVAATGSGPLSYQWAADGVPIAGETSAVLSLPAVGEDDVGDFSVTVSNALGSVVSQSASVILLGAPVIWTDPSDVSVYENSTTTFRVDAGGSNLHYQWLRNGSPIASSDSDAYTTPSLTVADSGAVYSVIVYNGSGLIVSGPAVLTVTAAMGPTILQPPADVTITAGMPANICMAFGGTPPLYVRMHRWNGAEWAQIGSGPGFPINDNAPFCTTTPTLQLADNGAQFLFFASNAVGGIVEAMTRIVTVTVTAPPLAATTLASRATSGATANNRSGAPTLSADGNLVAFISDGTNLVPDFNGDAFTAGYAYVRNLTTGVTTLINQTPEGTRSSRGVIGLKLAAGGRYAIFSSLAGDLVYNDTNGSQDVFVRDLQNGTTTRVNLQADGTESPPSGNGQGDMRLDISADGRFVVFYSGQDLIGDGSPGDYSLYFRSTQTGYLRRVATTSTASGTIGHSALSDDGEHLAYLHATFAPGAWRNTIVHYDAEANTSTEAFSIDSTNNESYVGQGISISSNGRYIAFPLHSPTTFNGSTFTQVLAVDRDNPEHITIASGDSNGFGNGHSIHPEVSDDGHVLFFTNAGNLTGGLANAVYGTLVVRDLQSTTLNIAARRANGTPVLTISGYDYHALSSDGSALAFVANELDVSGSGMNEYQVYVAPRP